MKALIWALPLGTLCWIGIFALAFSSPFLLAVGACILGIIVCGAMLAAGAVVAEHAFPPEWERRHD